MFRNAALMVTVASLGALILTQPAAAQTRATAAPACTLAGAQLDQPLTRTQSRLTERGTLRIVAIRQILDRGRRRVVEQRNLSEPPRGAAQGALPGRRHHGPESRGRRRGRRRHARPFRPRRDRRKARPSAVAGRQQRHHARSRAFGAAGAAARRHRTAAPDGRRHGADRSAIHDRRAGASGRRADGRPYRGRSAPAPGRQLPPLRPDEGLAPQARHPVRPVQHRGRPAHERLGLRLLRPQPRGRDRQLPRCPPWHWHRAAIEAGCGPHDVPGRDLIGLQREPE